MMMMTNIKRWCILKMPSCCHSSRRTPFCGSSIPLILFSTRVLVLPALLIFHFYLWEDEKDEGCVCFAWMIDARNDDTVYTMNSSDWGEHWFAFGYDSSLTAWFSCLFTRCLLSIMKLLEGMLEDLLFVFVSASLSSQELVFEMIPWVYPKLCWFSDTKKEKRQQNRKKLKWKLVKSSTCI